MYNGECNGGRTVAEPAVVPSAPCECDDLLAKLNKLVKQRVQAAELCGDLAGRIAELETHLDIHVSKTGSTGKLHGLFQAMQASYSTVYAKLMERL